MMLKRLLREAVELPCFNVALKLLVPSLRVELSKPIAELRQLFGAKGLNLAFNFRDLAHFTPHFYQYIIASFLPGSGSTLALTRVLKLTAWPAEGPQSVS